MASRRNITAARLRNKIRKTKESLADQFDFKMFIVIDFKSESKKSAVFEIERVHPMMTNDYEEKIVEGIKKSKYDAKSSIHLLTKDVVQLHARKWQCKRRDVIGCSEGIDFMMWPRNDVESIRCQLFSRWKHESRSPFKPYSTEFTIKQCEYDPQLAEYRELGLQNSCVLTNSEQNMFLFLSRHTCDTSRGQAMIYRMHSLCVYLPQAELINWSHGTMEKVMMPLLDQV